MSRTVFFATASSIALITATPALADVTAEEVWANLNAPILALGAQMEAEATRKDNRLEIGETTYRFVLPMQLGEVRMTSSGMSLAENGDGTVALLYPSEMYFSFSVDGPQGQVASAAMSMEGASYGATASGVPGDVTYDYKLSNGTIRLGELNVPEVPMMKIDMSGSMSGMDGTYRITEGDLVRMSGEGGMGQLTFDMKMVDELGIETTGGQTTSGGRSTFEMVIPTGKLSIMNLAQGLRDGFSVKISGGGTRYESTSVSTLDGEPLVVQNYGYVTDDLNYAIDASGLSATGRNSDIWMEYQIAEFLPVLMKGKADAVESTLVLPLNATGDVADVGLDVVVENLTVDEDLWDMLDPGAQLPRDPANLVLNLSGQVELLMDLLDINRWMAMGTDIETPVLLHALKLDALDLDMAGLAVDGTGAFTFDNSDYETFDGVPAVDGTLTLGIAGADGLIDKLIAMGLITEEDAMGARMMMGVFAVPGEGEDTLRSVIEVKPDGQVSANGQRLR